MNMELEEPKVEVIEIDPLPGGLDPHEIGVVLVGLKPVDERSGLSENDLSELLRTCGFRLH